MPRGVDVVRHVADEGAFRRGQLVAFQDAEDPLALVEHAGVGRFEKVRQPEVVELPVEGIAVHAGEDESAHAVVAAPFQLFPGVGQDRDRGLRCREGLAEMDLQLVERNPGQHFLIEIAVGQPEAEPEAFAVERRGEVRASQGEFADGSLQVYVDDLPCPALGLAHAVVEVDGLLGIDHAALREHGVLGRRLLPERLELLAVVMAEATGEVRDHVAAKRGEPALLVPRRKRVEALPEGLPAHEVEVVGGVEGRGERIEALLVGGRRGLADDRQHRCVEGVDRFRSPTRGVRARGRREDRQNEGQHPERELPGTGLLPQHECHCAPNLAEAGPSTNAQPRPDRAIPCRALPLPGGIPTRTR